MSTATASLALNGDHRVAEATRRKVEQASRRLGYRPNSSAVALRTGRSGLIGLVIRNLRNPFFLDFIEAFDDACAARGYTVMIGTARYDAVHEEDLVGTLVDRGADGLVLAPLGNSTMAQRWTAATGRPAVLVNAAQLADGPMVHHVHVDGVDAVEQAVAHLAGLGHHRLALVSAPAGKCADPERVDAFRRVIRRRRLSGTVVRSELEAAAVRTRLAATFGRPISTRPTGVITNSDYLAQAVYEAVRDAGLQVPHDVSVVGHDDLPTSSMLAPPLTTLRVDRRALGAAAARSMIDALEHGAPSARTVIPVTLTLRGSTASPPHG